VRKKENKFETWVSPLSSWYRVEIYRMDGCGRTEYRGENLDDQDKIFLLEDEFRV